MKQQINTLKIKTKGQGLYEFTSNIVKYVNEEKIENGLLTIYIKHTSCSLLIQENADSDVKKDLLTFFSKIAPENENYIHKSEGPDDMPAHIKSSLTQTNLSIPIENYQIVLGTWQGVYLFEHRKSPHTRVIKMHLIG
ncbi:MAG: secondary thiamine-phosphate synthase enzyme YjbQ [Alphaproteobacteria bacterium]|nr:secondary thiamine-phosphate synthase enzyme YjbQ [Alphaproteobacteria bacterium]